MTSIRRATVTISGVALVGGITLAGFGGTRRHSTLPADNVHHTVSRSRCAVHGRQLTMYSDRFPLTGVQDTVGSSPCSRFRLVL